MVAIVALDQTWLPGLRVEKVEAVMAYGGCKRFTARLPGDAADDIFKPGKRSLFVWARDVPDSERVIATAGNELLAVRRPSN